MLKAIDILPDTYRGGRYLRRWQIVNGFPRCTFDALDMEAATEAEISAVRSNNINVAERLAAVEAYENALLLTSRDQPLQYIDVYERDGGVRETENAAWREYHDALSVVDNATDITLAYATVRKGKPPASSPDYAAYESALVVIESAQ